MNFEVLDKKFGEYFNPEKNVTYERHMFLSRDKKPDESIDDYITDLRDLSASCEFETLTDSLITSKLILGLKSDVELQNKLIRTKNISLSKAVDICRVAERTKEQLEKISSVKRNNLTVDKIKKRGHHGETGAAVTKFTSEETRFVPRPSTSQGTSRYQRVTNESVRMKNNSEYVKSGKFNCYRCGTQHEKNRCPAFGKMCAKCRKSNHFAKMCKSVSEVQLQVYDDLFIDCVNDNDENEWKVLLDVHNGTKIRFKLDTGAQVNIIPANFLEKLEIIPNNLIYDKATLKTYTGEKIRILGKCNLNCKIKELSEYLTFYIVDEQNVVPILGKEDCQKLKLIQLVHSLKAEYSQDAHYEKIIKGFNDVFTGLGCLEGTFNIKLEPNACPKIHVPRKVPIAVQEKSKNKLLNLEKNKIIVRVDHPTDWVNSFSLFQKSVE
ncbi:uncharacterized protein [Leptinotarsa decemlineata]|uniref:uncharacterized protein n=1 Tax=Leptinotarsa decemlineata TaxID=7539 RepID=UPI003D307748